MHGNQQVVQGQGGMTSCELLYPFQWGLWLEGGSHFSPWNSRWDVGLLPGKEVNTALLGCWQLQTWLCASYRTSTTALDKQPVILTAAERRLAVQTRKHILVAALYHRANNCFPAEDDCAALPTGKSARQEIWLPAGVLPQGNFIQRATSHSVIAILNQGWVGILLK